VAVLEQLVEELGGLQPVAELGRHGGDHRLVDLGEPPGRAHRGGDRPTLVLLEPRPEALDVRQEPPGLVLLHLETGPLAQGPEVVPLVDDRGRDAQLPAVRTGADGQLLDVEPEVVDAAHPGVDPPPLGVVDALGAGELGPQGLVAAHQVVGDGHRVDVGPDPSGGLEVEHPAHQVLVGEVEVVAPQSVADRGTPLGGLRVDEVGHQPAGVASEQDVRRRAVAPVHAGEVQAHQQHDRGVQQQVGRGRVAGDQVPVRQ